MPWESDTEFNAWVRSLPEKTWAKNDISACWLGWEAHKHNLAQPEWPSEEDADRVWDALSERCGENDFPSIDDVRAALQSVRPPAVPMEGHAISVKSCDGEWEGEARWEHQEQAYVTNKAVRPPDGVVSDEEVSDT